jgi:hypothetical protein
MYKLCMPMTTILSSGGSLEGVQLTTNTSNKGRIIGVNLFGIVI